LVSWDKPSRHEDRKDMKITNCNRLADNERALDDVLIIIIIIVIVVIIILISDIFADAPLTSALDWSSL